MVSHGSGRAFMLYGLRGEAQDPAGRHTCSSAAASNSDMPSVDLSPMARIASCGLMPAPSAGPPAAGVTICMAARQQLTICQAVVQR